MKLLFSVLVTVLVLSGNARAQWGTFTYFNGPNGLSVSSTGEPVEIANTNVQVGNTRFCQLDIGCARVIPLSAFADILTVTTANALLNNRIDASFAAVAAAQNQVNARITSLNADVSRSLEIGAIAASMRDAIPNPGDRFAIRLNAAGFEGYAGGSIGVSMNLTDAVRLSANYGRGATQNIFSGGVNISFR